MRRKRATTMSCALPFHQGHYDGLVSVFQFRAPCGSQRFDAACQLQNQGRPPQLLRRLQMREEALDQVQPLFLFSSRGFVNVKRNTFGGMPMRCMASMRSKFPRNMKNRVTVGCESTY